ncbi:hypothetical protein BCR34DRAFT_625833 [Clohesyomyces aquaticus]|uniref:Uncharacterized protein n=1 Tax=Clohesyomyces aquaticus TaxID=1231657 RepID=A0A1Y1ZGB3_9PLEO|nr:hypothetical protein BCR34DRAFT_625833 [Clohesyomyces aquaticus]
MAAPSIPLHCNICPKKPNFSDVSHLLTHIASKGHLSHYYKIKVRSGSEDASRRLIEAYDRWYAEWNVEDLMSERMSQKDKRRTRTRTMGMVSPPPRQKRLALLDPRLSEHHLVKVEASSVTPTPPPTGPILRHRGFPPRMQYWPTGSRSTSHSYTNPDYETSSEYSDPSDRRLYQYTVDDSCAIEDDPADAAPFSAEGPTAGGSECTKLKGVYWPGMDLFDSATPEMRRKRNQKKDISVVEQLELNSQEVEPTELIFTPHGSFKKQRRISGSVYDDEESSPIKAESPRNLAYLTRPALADLDRNAAPRTLQHVRPPAYPYPARNTYDNERNHSSYGYGDHHGQRRRRPFNVFQDDEVTFSQPANFNYLTAGYHHHHSQQPSPSPAAAFAPYKAYNDPYPGYDNKENVLPSFNPPAYSHHHHHHHHQQSGYNYPAYSYGLGHDHYPFQSGHPMYANSEYQQQQNDAADDQRTITAPPSPSTS